MIAPIEAPKAEQYLALRELAARGAQNAASGLSEMVGRPIGISTPEVSMVPMREVQTLLGDPEATVVGIYLSLGGDVRGHILLILAPSEAMGLVDMLMDVPAGTTLTLGSMERSALGEVGNLSSSFFLNALAELTQLNGYPSPPAVMIDMAAAVLEVPLSFLAYSSEDALVINTLFMDSQRHIEAVFLVMPDMASLKTILDRLEKRWPSR